MKFFQRCMMFWYCCFCFFFVLILSSCSLILFLDVSCQAVVLSLPLCEFCQNGGFISLVHSVCCENWFYALFWSNRVCCLVVVCIGALSTWWDTTFILGFFLFYVVKLLFWPCLLSLLFRDCFFVFCVKLLLCVFDYCVCLCIWRCCR